MLASIGAINPAASEGPEPAVGDEAAQIAHDLVLPALPPACHRRRIAFKVAAASSMLLHAGTLLALVGWLSHEDAGAIPQPSEAVSVEMVASATLEALQPEKVAEPAPAPEATAPVEGETVPSEVTVPKSEPPPEPEPEPVEPSPAAVPDAKEEVNRATQRGEPTETPAPPAPVEAPAEVMREPPKAKVADEQDTQAKRKEVEKVERNARKRARKGGRTSKARAGKGTDSSRASASRGSILSYGAKVRARVFANKPSGGGLRGTVRVSFGVTPTGRLAFARIARSSGHAAVDRLALAAVRAAAPFPTPPAGARSAQLRFSIPFYFE